MCLAVVLTGFLVGVAFIGGDGGAGGGGAGGRGGSGSGLLLEGVPDGSFGVLDPGGGLLELPPMSGAISP